MIHEARIKDKVKKAINLKPTHIKLMRPSSISNGMRGTKPSLDFVAEFDALLNDSRHSILQSQAAESGTVQRIRSLTLLAVCDGFEIKKGDCFTFNDLNYKVTYPGMIFTGLYNADLEVI